MALEPLLIVPDAVAVAAAVAAAVVDQRRRRIPDGLTVGAGVAGLGLAALLGGLAGGAGGAGHALAAAFAGAALGLVGVGLLGAAGLVGMGDVKLVAGLGALVRWPVALPLVLYTAVAGGVVAVVHAVARGRVDAVARNLTGARAGADRAGLHPMPYGWAIALGCAWAVAARYLDAVRLL